MSSGLDKGPPNPREAERWLRVAERLLDGARLAMARKPVESLAHASKAIEFSVKSLLYLVGYVPRPGRPTGSTVKLIADHVDGANRERLSALRARAGRVGLLYDATAPLQSISHYALAGTPPRQLVTEADARTFRAYAEECVDWARQTLAQFREGALTVV